MQYRNRADVEFIIPQHARAGGDDTAQEQQRQSHPLDRIACHCRRVIRCSPDQRSSTANYFEVILSQSAAKKLKVRLGDEIDASLARQFQGKRERVHLPLESSILPMTVSPRAMLPLLT